MVNGYPFSLGTSGYPVPLGGTTHVLVPGKIAVHDVAFIRVFLEFGNRCSVIRLGAPPTDESSAAAPTAASRKAHSNDVVVFNPIPWGVEAQDLLRALVPTDPSDTADASDVVSRVNVKYIVAPDYEHHMALKGWKEQFPGARILGVEGLPEKKRKDGVAVDYVFTGAVAGKLITQDLISSSESIAASLPLPADLTTEFDFVYVPEHPNKEIVALHKPTRTLFTGDLLFNLPATSQYAAYPHINPASGLSFLARFLTIDSWLLRTLLGSMPASAAPSLQALRDWEPETLVPAHGDIVTERATQRFATLFAKYLKK